MIKKRLGFLDIAKAVGICLVVLGHTNPPSGAVKLIYAFHMPLFFFISGYLFSFSKYPSAGSFFKTKAQQLLIPYLSLNIISYLFWLFVSRNFGIDNAANVPIYKPLIGMLYGNGINDFLHHCVPLWFLICLFVVESLFYLLFKDQSKKVWILLLLGLIGYFDHRLDIVRLPWGINIAFTAIVFYGAGNLFKGALDKVLQTRKLFLILYAVPLIMVMGLIAMRNGVPDMNGRIYNNYLYFIIGAFCGIMALLFIAKLLEKIIIDLRAFEFLAMNTLVILGFHKIVGELIKGFLWFAFKIPAQLFNSALLLDLMLAFAEIIVLIPLIFFINTYCPVLIGKETVPTFLFRFKKRASLS